MPMRHPRRQSTDHALAPQALTARGIEQRTDFREETIYFLLTARFNDGDPSNNFFCRDRIRFDDQGNAIDPHWRGDFKGLIARLDYIRDLGFSAIWITPPVENRSGLDYHGYHAYDWTRVDPRLESPDATYQDLIDAAHAKGIKIIQDVVVNHSCQYGIRGKVHIDHLPIKYYVPQGSEQGRVDHGPYQGHLGNYAWPHKDDIDNPVAPDWYRQRHGSDAEGIEPLVDPKTGETVPKPGYDPGRFFGIDANALDPEWYHQDGFICGGDWESQQPLQQRHMAGDCIDLATERQNVKDYIIQAINRYLDMGVDALRIDTVKHVERGNLLEYVNAWKAHKPGLFVFGENLVKGYGWGDLGGGDNGPSQIRPWWYTRLGDDPRDPASGGDSDFPQLDFGLFSTFRDTVSKGTYGGTGQILSMDWIYGDVTQLVTFLQNHDVGPDNDFKYRFKGEQWMAAATYNLLWTARGIPCLYYGEEIEFMHGAPQDVEGEKDTLESTGRAYFGDHLTDAQIAADPGPSDLSPHPAAQPDSPRHPGTAKGPHDPGQRVGQRHELRARSERSGQLCRGRARHRLRPTGRDRRHPPRPLSRRRQRRRDRHRRPPELQRTGQLGADLGAERTWQDWPGWRLSALMASLGMLV